MTPPDRDEYAALVRAHHGRILRLCQVLLSDPVEAEDAAQDVFVKAYQSLHRFQGDSSFLTWITRIAYNHCMDVLRKRSRQKTESLEHLPESLHPTTPMLRDDSARELLASLRPDYKEILALREVAGHSYEEIAALLKTSLDSVKAKLRRARQELQEKARHFLGAKNV